MHRLSIRAVAAAAFLVAATATTTAAQSTAYALTTVAGGAQQLVRFDPATPGMVSTVGPTGVRLTGIDFRPATNQLYGYDGDRIYVLDLATGAAGMSLDVGNVAGNAAFDFNPTVDRIRAVGPSGVNFRLNPMDGSTITDGAYTFAMGDVNMGRVPQFTAVAYTNSDNDPSTGTTLFGIDPTLGQLIRISSPNGGSVNTVGSLGIGQLSSVVGFDILTVGTSNVAYFAGMVNGATSSQLFTVNLETGSATLVGDIGAFAGVEGLALTTVPEPSTYALMATGLLGLGAAARRRRVTPNR